MDKIKEANKELFSNESAAENELIAEAQQNRKVSFATNLEEYEPHNGINLKELEDKLGKTDAKENLEEIEIAQKLDVITEEEGVHEIEINENSENNCEDTDPIEKKLVEQQYNLIEIMNNENEENLNVTENPLESPIKDNENLEENTILEEICEEILIMDMESDKVDEIVATKFDSPSAIQRKILKQITFDYTGEDDDGDNGDDDEVDNKSLTNLLISDNDNEPSDDDEVDNQEYNCNESINEDSDCEEKLNLTNNDFEENDDEEDDDDKLSIIVASYLPDDMACDKTSLTSSSLKHSARGNKSRKLPFNKRFSFRRKTKSSNAIGSSFTHHHSSANNRRFMPPPEVTDLKLHYKTCCDFKNVQQKLPKYTGYLSEYGLSKEQLLDRERKLQQKQQGKEVKTLRSTEAEMRKIHDNERAFTTWLKNKMRFPINKTRNMFDVKRPFGLRKCTSVGGNTLNDDTKQILYNTKYRSISAKLKRS